jgi:hypothetical protein
MRIVTALLLVTTMAFAVHASVSAATLSRITTGHFVSAPAGTTDAVRQQAGYRVLRGSYQTVAHLEPTGTTDAIRQQAGYRVLRGSYQAVAHLEPTGTTDAIRQQAGWDQDRLFGQRSPSLAVNPIE